MPRNYNTNDNSGGTNMVGRAYTPQVTPWDRDSDDVSVQRSLREDRQEWRDQRDAHTDQRGGRSLDRDYDYRARDSYGDRNGREQDAYNRRDLVPGYGDDRVGFQNSGNSERDDGHRAGKRAHWENREPDYRYQYNDYRRADENDVRRENQARYSEHRQDHGYRRENTRDTWMNDRSRQDNGRQDNGRQDYGREDYDRDRYNERERYYARDNNDGDYQRGNDDRERGRWNRR